MLIFSLLHVYYVSSPDVFLNPVGICPKFKVKTEHEATVVWDDTSKEIGFHVVYSNPSLTQPEELKKAEKITFVTAENYHIVFEILTKKIYLEKVKPRSVGGVDETTTESIRKHYLEQSFGMF